MQELIDCRTVRGKLYDLGNGRFRQEISQWPMHYESNGQLHGIDLTPEEDGDNHAIRHCPYSLKVAKSEPAYAYNTLGGKRVGVELVTDARGGVYDGRLFRWSAVGVDTDYAIYALPYGVSTLLTLHGGDSPRKWSWNVCGDISLIRPLVGRDSAGRILELAETRTVADDGQASIHLEWTGRTTTRQTLRKSGPVWSTDVTYPVLIDPVVNENIGAGADDVFSNWSGSGATLAAFNATYQYLQAGRYGTLRIYAGLRFQTVNVPSGATINSATLTVNVPIVSGSPNINIIGNDVDDAADWSNPGNLVKNISRTAAVVNKTSWTSGADNAIDVTSIVAEIIGRAGWAANNDIGFGFFNNAGADAIIIIAALEHATLTEPRLSIDYTAPAGSEAGRKPGRGLTQSVLLRPRALIN